MPATSPRLEAVRRLGVSSEELDRRALVARVDEVVREGLQSLRKLNPLWVRGRSCYPGDYGDKDRRFDWLALSAPWPMPPSRKDEEDKMVTYFVRPRYALSKARRWSRREPVCRRPADLLGVQVQREAIWLHGKTYYSGGRWREQSPTFARLQRSFRMRQDGTFNWGRIHEVIADDALELEACRSSIEAQRDSTSHTAHEVQRLLKSQSIPFRRTRQPEENGGVVTFHLGAGEIRINVDKDKVQVAVKGPLRAGAPTAAVSTALALLAITSEHETDYRDWSTSRGY